VDLQARTRPLPAWTPAVQPDWSPALRFLPAEPGGLLLSHFSGSSIDSGGNQEKNGGSEQIQPSDVI
jgi:hypothetical protein